MKDIALAVLLLLVVIMVINSSIGSSPMQQQQLQGGVSMKERFALPNEDTEDTTEMHEEELKRRYQALLADSDFDSNATTIEPAPRTFQGEYNLLLPNTKYFIYSPSGGMGNQLIELASACHLAKIMDRTLLVPMLGSHSSMWYNYERLPEDALYPMDRILDFPRLAEYCQVQPLNISVVEFMKRQSPEQVYEVFHRYRKFWQVQDLVSAIYQNRKMKIFYLRGAEMFHRWMEADLFLRVQLHVRFSQYLRWRALEVVRQAFPPNGEFNSMHIRLGDYIARWPESISVRSRAIVTIANKHKGKNESLPMYLASDEPNNAAFKRLRSERKVVTIYELPKKLVKDYGGMFSKKFRLDMEGVLDQLICSAAKDFIPTTWSTFSSNILHIRAHKRELFPELKE